MLRETKPRVNKCACPLFFSKTYEAKRFETFGPPNEHRRELYREVVMFGDWIYAAIGAQPWHLVAFNFHTGELGGMPLAEHRIFWMTGAADARYIVLSSKCEDQGRLFVWDTQSHDFRHRVDLELFRQHAGAD
jgi:hypothetical protein